MSYRIYAFQPLAGVDPWETGRRIAYGPDEDETIVVQEEKNSLEIDLDLAAILKRQWSALQEVRFDSADLDQIQQTTPDETPEPADLFLIEPETGVRIGLENRIVDVWVPFYFAPDSALAVFTQIWSCLEALVRERGYAAYDPHLDQILNLSSDMPAVLGKYCKWMVSNPGLVQMERAILDADLAEDDLQAADRPWYSGR